MRAKQMSAAVTVLIASFLSACGRDPDLTEFEEQYAIAEAAGETKYVLTSHPDVEVERTINIFRCTGPGGISAGFEEATFGTLTINGKAVDMVGSTTDQMAPAVLGFCAGELDVQGLREFTPEYKRP
jgi:hypothetical protein